MLEQLFYLLINFFFINFFNLENILLYILKIHFKIFNSLNEYI